MAESGPDRELVRRFLHEDRAEHDVTVRAVVPSGVLRRAVISAKQSGVVAGVDVARAVFAELDATVAFAPLVVDGDVVGTGTVVAELHGPWRSLLAGERVALNLLQRMSGVASLTARFVGAVRGTGTVILATRKTAPGLRPFDLAAVRAGGGDAHRESLADRVLVKSNHLVGSSVAEAVVRLCGPDGPSVPIAIEVTDLRELADALVPGIGVVLLDNFGPGDCAAAVRRRDERFPGGDGPRLEASGGITLENVAAFAEAGVDRISVGALTHSAPALDLSMTVLDADGADR